MTVAEKNADKIRQEVGKQIAKGKKSGLYDIVGGKIDLGRLTPQQFQGRFVLPALRAAARSNGNGKSKISAKPTTGTKSNGSKESKVPQAARERVREVLDEVMSEACGVSSSKEAYSLARKTEHYADRITSIFA